MSLQDILSNRRSAVLKFVVQFYSNEIDDNCNLDNCSRFNEKEDNKFTQTINIVLDHYKNRFTKSGVN
jgi:hypothetical protein